MSGEPDPLPTSQAAASAEFVEAGYGRGDWHRALAIAKRSYGDATPADDAEWRDRRRLAMRRFREAEG